MGEMSQTIYESQPRTKSLTFGVGLPHELGFNSFLSPFSGAKQSTQFLRDGGTRTIPILGRHITVTNASRLPSMFEISERLCLSNLT